MEQELKWKVEQIDPINEEGKHHVRLEGGIKFYARPDELAAAGITPPPDPPNFATLPIGTVVQGSAGVDEQWVKMPDGWVSVDFEEQRWTQPVAEDGPYTVVHQPAAPSVRDALHTLGYTDQEINEVAAKPTPPYGGRFYFACVDAAREAEQQP